MKGRKTIKTTAVVTTTLVGGIAVASQTGYAENIKETNQIEMSSKEQDVSVMTSEEVKVEKVKVKEDVITKEKLYNVQKEVVDLLIADINNSEENISLLENKLNEVGQLKLEATSENIQKTQENIVQSEEDVVEKEQEVLILEQDLQKIIEQINNQENMVQHSEYEVNTILQLVTNAENKVLKVKEAVGETDSVKLQKELNEANQQLSIANQVLSEAIKALENAKQEDSDRLKNIQNALNTLNVEKQKATELVQTLNIIISDINTKTSELANIQKVREQAEEQLNQGVPSNIEIDKTPIRHPEVDTPNENNVFVGRYGTFAPIDKDVILKRLNDIRLEAYNEGLVDRYVPIKWSTALEKAAMIRSAESDVTDGHVRLNDKTVYSAGVNKEEFLRGGRYGSAENLAWNYDRQLQGILSGIEQWYSEKTDLVNNTGRETGHYTSIINPNYTYVGLGGFVFGLNEEDLQKESNNPMLTYTDEKHSVMTSVAQLFSSAEYALPYDVVVNADYKITQDIIDKHRQPISEKAVGSYGYVNQLLEVHTKYLKNIRVAEQRYTLPANSPTKIKILADLYYFEQYPELNMPIEAGLTWKSSDETIATIDTNGNVTGHKNGEVTITATLNGVNYITDVTIIDTSSAQNELTQLTQKYNTVNEEINRLQNNRNNITNHLNTVNVIVDQLQQKYNEMVDAPLKESKAQEHKYNAEANANAIQSRIATIQSQLAIVTGDEKVKLQALNDANDELNSVKEQLQVAQSELNVKRETLTILQNQKKNIETRLNDKKLEVLQAEKLVDQLKIRLDSLKNVDELFEQAKNDLDEALLKLNLKKEQLAIEIELLNELQKQYHNAKQYYEKLLQLCAQLEMIETVNREQNEVQTSTDSLIRTLAKRSDRHYDRLPQTGSISNGVMEAIGWIFSVIGIKVLRKKGERNDR